MLKRCFIVILCLFIPLIVFAQNGRKQVEEGNKLYFEEKFDEANNKYRDAQLENPESPVVDFNIGNVQYKKRNYEEALKSYEKSQSSDDILVQSKSYYNTGNTLYRLGKLPESILAYKKALELNPDDEDAKYNLEFVRAKLKDNSQNQDQQNQDQQRQQQQQQDGGQGQQDQEQQDQQKNQQGQQEQKDEEQQGQPNEEQKEQQAQQEEQQTEPQSGEQKEISKEDAERILEALKGEEKDLLKEQKPKMRSGAFRGKDW